MIMATLTRVARHWWDARPRVVVDQCHCGIGCTERPTVMGYNRHMEWVSLAPGHGRKTGGES